MKDVLALYQANLCSAFFGKMVHFLVCVSRSAFCCVYEIVSYCCNRISTSICKYIFSK